MKFYQRYKISNEEVTMEEKFVIERITKAIILYNIYRDKIIKINENGLKIKVPVAFIDFPIPDKIESINIAEGGYLISCVTNNKPIMWETNSYRIYLPQQMLSNISEDEMKKCMKELIKSEFIANLKRQGKSETCCEITL